MRRLGLSCVFALLGLSLAPYSCANTFFADQATTPTGSFEWSLFSGAYTDAHAPNASSGVGAATLTGDSFTVPPPPFQPSPQIFGGALYTGGRNGRFPTALTGASTAGASTTVVLQLAVDSESSEFVAPATFLLGGSPAVEFVSRGVGSDDLRYYWAEWQTGAAANLTLSFDTLLNHFALVGAQLDYYNAAAPFDAVAPGQVPEPAAVSLAGLALGAFALQMRRKTRVAAIQSVCQRPEETVRRDIC